MDFSELRLGELLERVAERGPGPAGGAALAATIALAAALAELAGAAMHGLRERALALAQEDVEAYAAFMREGTPETRERTIEVPLRLVEAAAEVARAAGTCAARAAPPLNADASVAARLATAAAHAAADLVAANVGDVDDERVVRARAAADALA